MKQEINVFSPVIWICKGRKHQQKGGAWGWCFEITTTSDVNLLSSLPSNDVAAAFFPISISP